MRHRPTHAAATTVLVVALLSTGCSQGTDGPAERPPRDMTVTSSAPVPTSPLAPTSPDVPQAPRTPPAPPRSPDVPQAPRTPPAPPFIAGTTWGDSDYGVTLKVAPSAAGRQAWGADDSRTAWQEVLRLSPDADTPGMWEQFDCHWAWARLLEPAKATWNLEPWRPVVSPERMLAEGCNPGGPEV